MKYECEISPSYESLTRFMNFYDIAPEQIITIGYDHNNDSVSMIYIKDGR
ncbi:hypothetical protein phi9181_ORF018 [Enterococcus phage 9181]|nr:hypothetical protein phi9181_ORF018 [Enterococcus phage 9181]